MNIVNQLLKIGQRWPEDEMYKWGSYFGHVPKHLPDR